MKDPKSKWQCDHCSPSSFTLVSPRTSVHTNAILYLHVKKAFMIFCASLLLFLLAVVSCASAWSTNKKLLASTATPAQHHHLALFSHDNNNALLDEQETTTTKNPASSSIVKSVNYFISRACNYSCEFCFHTQKTSYKLPLAMAKYGLTLLHQAGTEKVNFAGGEPFLHPRLLGELCRLAHQELNMAVSIISNGSLITPQWMEQYGTYVDVLGISVDSFQHDTNIAIGRGEKTNNFHIDRALMVRELCRQHDIKFKLNTVVCSLNWQEDMATQVKRLQPDRWKVFQVLLLQDENVGGPHQLRDARNLVVTDRQFQAFVQRHQHKIPQLIPEPNNVMQNSYLLLDEEMRFLDCSQGGKVPGQSILQVGVHEALRQAGFDHEMFQKRGGIYDWKRERTDRP